MLSYGFRHSVLIRESGLSQVLVLLLVVLVVARRRVGLDGIAAGSAGAGIETGRCDLVLLLEGRVGRRSID